ncbi:unnamed protein product [Dicrocoelium dendriticum]|nr:unnamed protein product [Dicrocoelium dendriticum]
MAVEVLQTSSELVQAIFAGNHDQCVRLINPESANQQDLMKRSILHAAAHCGESHITELLLREGARVNAKDARWLTPLHRACATNAAEVVKLLLARGADRNARDRNWQTPLHVAASNGSLECVQLLLVPSDPITTNVNASDRTGHSALHHAVCGGHLEVVRLLLLKGASVSAFDKRDRRAMHWAASSGQVMIVELLHEFGAEINCRDADLFTPLHVAAALGHAPVVKCLIELGAELDSLTARGNTPLHIACLNGQDEVVELLLEHIGKAAVHSSCAIGHVSAVADGDIATATKANESLDQGTIKANAIAAAVNKASTMDQLTPIHLAVLTSNGAQCLISLLNACSAQSAVAGDNCEPVESTLHTLAIVDAPGGENGSHPIHLAALHGRFDCAELLLKHGAASDVHDHLGDSPLHIAAERGHESFIVGLSRTGCRWDIRDRNGATALHRAALSGNHICLFRLICMALADVIRVDEVGSNSTTPSDQQVGQDRDNLVDVVNFEDDPVVHSRLHEVMRLRDDHGRTLVHDAALGANLDCLKLVLLSGGDPFAADYSGRTPLHYTVASCVFATHTPNAVLRATLSSLILLKLGVEVNVSDKYGCTPLHLACAYDTSGALVRHLIHYGADVFRLTGWPSVISNMDTPIPSDAAATEQQIDQQRPLDEPSYSPLHIAVNVLNIPAVKLLLETCPNHLLRQFVLGSRIRPTDSPPTAGRCDYQPKLTLDNHRDTASKGAPSPFLLAAFRGNVSIMRMLLDAWKTSTSSICADDPPLSHRNVNVNPSQSVSLPAQVVDASGHSALHLACYAGHVDICRLLLKDASHIGTVIDAKDSVYQWHALHHAAAQGHYDVAALLLEHTHDMDQPPSAPGFNTTTGGCNIRHNRDEHGRTALMLAAQNDHPAVLRLLLSDCTAGGSKLDNATLAVSYGMNLQDFYGRTALHRAVANGHVECVKVLLACNVDHGILDFRRRHVLHMAASSGKVATLTLLLNHLTRVCKENGKDPYSQVSRDMLCPLDQYGFTPLHFAAYRGHLDCIQCLLNFACYEDLRGNLYTPLHCAAQNGHSSCLQLLLGQFGLKNLSTVDSCGRTVLHIAAMRNQVTCVDEVLRYAEFCSSTLAQECQDSSVMRSRLLHIGSFVTRCDNAGRTALMLAASTGHDGCVQLLLRMHSRLTNELSGLVHHDGPVEDSNEVACILNRLAITFTDSNGQSALHHACAASNGLAALAILDNNVQDAEMLSQRDRSERTALHLAISSGLVIATEALINRGADLYAMDTDGLIPAFAAASSIRVRLAFF